MKPLKKHLTFTIATLLLIYLTSIMNEKVSAVACTFFAIIVIIHYGMKGGLAFTLVISAVIIRNFYLAQADQTFLPIMGIITYVSISIGIGIPIDLMKKEQKNRIAGEERLRRITNNLQDVIIQINRNGIIQYISPSCSKVFGQAPEYYIGRSFYSEVHPEERQAVLEKIEIAFDKKGLELIQYRYGEEYGNYIWVESLGQVVASDKTEGYEMVINCRDIAERKKTEEKIEYLSYHDVLTGLYNRAYFEEMQNKFVENNILPLSIIIGDVNGLKITNDVFGHYEGDTLLKKTADILTSCCRKEDIAVRWGGDEFAILMPGADEETTLDIISRIHSKCEEISKDPIKISIALGSATRKDSHEKIEHIVK
jgi:diguanylate cyclase (GGDEF)-like protein/PAS domain S-box-containing protein